jgi:hypothetical protein
MHRESPCRRAPATENHDDPLRSICKETAPHASEIGKIDDFDLAVPNANPAAWEFFTADGLIPVFPQFRQTDKFSVAAILSQSKR